MSSTFPSPATSTTVSMETQALLSYSETREILKWLSLLRLALNFFGIFTNSFNIYNFHQLGLKDSMTVLLFIQSVDDLLFSVVCVAYNGCQLIVEFIGFLNIFPDMIIRPEPFALCIYIYRATAYDMSAITTTFIALQRCCCVAFPLSFKRIFTVRKSVVIIILLYVFVISSNMPLFFEYGIALVKVPGVNKILTVLSVDQTVEEVRKKWTVVARNFLLAVSPLCVLVCFKVLAVNIARSNRFRKTASSMNTINADSIDSKQIQLVRTVFYLSLLFLCVTSTRILVILVYNLVPGFKVDGPQKNLNALNVSIVLVFENINTSINFFIYYNCNTAFKEITLKTAIGRFFVGK